MNKVRKMSSRTIPTNYRILLLFTFLFLLLNIQPTHSTVTTIIEEGYINISVSEAKNKIDTEPELFILDVRWDYEYEAGHISGAVHIPYTEIMNREHELPINKTHPILVYCKSGGRSQTASMTLVSLSYSQIFNMEGGFTAWKNAGYSYETGAYVIKTESSSNGITNSSLEPTSLITDSLTGPAIEMLFVFQAVCLMVIIAKRRH